MICNKCNIDKDDMCFHKNRKECKSCKSEYDKKYRQSNLEKCKNSVNSYQNRNKEKIREYNIEYQKSYRKSYYEENKDVILERTKENYRNNPQYLQVSKEYQKNNREKVNQYKRKYRKERVENDPLFKLIGTVRSLIGFAFRSNGYKKNTKTHQILSCGFEQFKLYIESQFIDGMTWENHGEWHLDHKTPISWAKSEEDVIRLSHYTNFKPMWAIENILKGNRYED